MSSDFLLSKFLLNKRCCFICAWSRFLISYIQFRKLLFSSPKSSDVCLPILSCDACIHIILHWTWIIISTKKHVFSIRCKSSCISSLDYVGITKSFCISIVSSRSKIIIFTQNKVLLFYLAISRPKELKIILFLLMCKITLFVDILILSWLASTL